MVLVGTSISKYTRQLTVCEEKVPRIEARVGKPAPGQRPVLRLRSLVEVVVGTTPLALELNYGCGRHYTGGMVGGVGNGCRGSGRRI